MEPKTKPYTSAQYVPESSGMTKREMESRIVSLEKLVGKWIARDLSIDIPSKQGICKHCGDKDSAHFAANFADGNLISGTILVCPRSTYEEKE